MQGHHIFTQNTDLGVIISLGVGIGLGRCDTVCDDPLRVESGVEGFVVGIGIALKGSGRMTSGLVITWGTIGSAMEINQ